MAHAKERFYRVRDRVLTRLCPFDPKQKDDVMRFMFQEVTNMCWGQALTWYPAEMHVDMALEVIFSHGAQALLRRRSGPSFTEHCLSLVMAMRQYMFAGNTKWCKHHRDCFRIGYAADAMLGLLWLQSHQQNRRHAV